LDESLKTKLKALGLAGLAALTPYTKASDMSVNFQMPATIAQSQRNRTASKTATDIDIVAATLYKEARGEGKKGMEAVNEVIHNRSKKKKKSLSQICTEPKQFSCWNNIAPTKDVIDSIAKKDPKSFSIAKKIASDDLTNHTKGAEYYHTLAVKPTWGPKLKKSGYQTVIIGNHIFYYKK
jgi:spore germination cell wall hydrolase CwlJ-like protein